MYPRQSRERKHFHPIIPHPHARARAIAIPSTPKSEFPTAPRGAPGGADHFFTPSIAPHAVARRRDRPSNASNITHEISSIRVTAQTHRAARIDIETRRWMPSSRIRESLAAFEPSHPSPGRPVVPPRARSHPPERRAPNHAHATKNTHTHNLVVRTCYLTAPNPTAARFEVTPRVVGRTARSTPRSLIEVNAMRGIFFTPGYFYLLSCWLNFLFYMEDVLIFWFVNRRFKTMAKRGATRTGPRHFARVRRRRRDGMRGVDAVEPRGRRGRTRARRGARRGASTETRGTSRKINASVDSQ